MSPLPLISHHLFVAAITPEQRRSRRAARAAAKTTAAERAGTPLALEVVDSAPALPRRGRASKPAWAGAV